MPRLRSVPDTPPRAVLYLRQSTHREESISLELQETACRDHATRMGYEVVAVESDPGISGRTWKRPAVQRVMGMVEDGAADVVVLWKWSRLSRNRRDWAVAVDRVDVAGGRIESATEPIDVATSAGRFARGVMAELAAFESERIGETWQEVHARRVAAGLPANGKPRFGYTYDRAAKMHVPDPDTGPLLAQAYTRYVAGESVYSLARWLNSTGATTVPGYGTSGGPWSDRSLRRVLDSGFAAGLISARGQTTTGVHTPLITADLWDAYRVARASRRVTRSNERSQYVLSGLVRCTCGSAMTGGQFGHGRVASFRCKAAKELGRHDGGYVAMHLLEDAVLAWLRQLAGDVDVAADTAARQQAAQMRRATDAQALSREITALDSQMTELTRHLIRGVIPETAYETVRDELAAQKAGLEARRLAAVVASRRPAAAQTARDLLAEWDVLGVEHRRGTLRDLIRHVEVTPGRGPDRIRVVPAWESG